MALEVVRDPRTRKEVTFVVGKVDGVYFNPLKNIKTHAGPKGPWTPTHSVNVVVDGTKVGFGITEKDAINSKDVDGNYHALARGMEVSVEITDTSEYQGKTQYSSKASKVTVLDATSVQRSASEGSERASGGFKRDTTGISVGHAINVAVNVLGTLDNPEDVIKFAKQAHDLSSSLQEEYAKNNPDLSDYDVGARVGHAVLSASHFVENVADIEEFARTTLGTIVPAVTAYVKGEDSSSTEKPKKPAIKKPVGKGKKVVEEQVDDVDIPETSFDDIDDEIPF